MKADTQYNDLVGTVAADISDLSTTTNRLEELASFFKINQERFKPVGISMYGTDAFYVAFICVDKEKSTDEKEHIVKIRVGEDQEDILDFLFKRLHVVLYDKFDKKYPELDYDEETSLSDYE